VATGTGDNKPLNPIKCRGFFDQLRKFSLSRGTAPLEVVESISSNCPEIKYNRLRKTGKRFRHRKYREQAVQKSRHLVLINMHGCLIPYYVVAHFSLRLKIH